ncbi:MAG: redoxin domain-containing protein [Thermodesulfobacteriota bacterium]
MVFLKGRSITYLLLPLLLCGLSSPSSAFAFRTLEIGKKVPEIQQKDVDGKELTLSSIKGGKVVLLFWGVDTAVKEKRSLSLMNRLESLYRKFKEEGLQFISIISDPDSREKVKTLKQQYSWTHPILLDEKREVYGAYGVYIIPTVGILDEEKRLIKALPFTHSIEEDVQGEILVALGKKTAEELERERHPKETLLPENKRKAQSHFNLGRSLLEKGSIEKAKEEFLKAIELDADYGEAYVSLGMVYLKEKNPEEALRSFEKGGSLNPSLRQGHLGLAHVFEARGQNSKAIEKLEEWLKTQKGTPDLHYYLGRLYEKEGLKERALSEYKKALQFIFKEE